VNYSPELTIPTEVDPDVEFCNKAAAALDPLDPSEAPPPPHAYSKNVSNDITDKVKILFMIKN
jgi:hypothetical protein